MLMRVLVACEFSGIVREAFRRRGHKAWSCDLRESELPGRHFVDDALAVIRNHSWDMVLAFPPCTHLCSSGAVYWPAKQKDGRQQTALEFVLLLNAPQVSRVCIENPVGILSTKWRKPDQIIQPFQFGEPYYKRTCLWLRGLPKLIPTKVVEPIAHWHGGVRRGGIKKDGTRTPSKLPTMLKYGERDRSRTFQGIADAMAEQWGKL
jgi:site-specific DNA-cytosine methylase